MREPEAIDRDRRGSRASQPDRCPRYPGSRCGRRNPDGQSDLVRHQGWKAGEGRRDGTTARVLAVPDGPGPATRMRDRTRIAVQIWSVAAPRPGSGAGREPHRLWHHRPRVPRAFLSREGLQLGARAPVLFAPGDRHPCPDGGGTRRVHRRAHHPVALDRCTQSVRPRHTLTCPQRRQHWCVWCVACFLRTLHRFCRPTQRKPTSKARSISGREFCHAICSGWSSAGTVQAPPRT